MNSSARIQNRAFTIIEIMVSMVIMGLIVAAVYSSWMCIVRGSQTGLRATAAIQRSRIAIRTLEDALWCARLFAADYQYYGFVAENGEDAQLSFVARLPPSFPRSGRFGNFDVRRVTFSLERSPDGGRELVLRQQPILTDMEIDEKEHPIVLAKNVSSFRLAFRGVPSASADWLDEWVYTNQLPREVEVILELGGNDQYSRRVEKVVLLRVALPAVTVQPTWQAPGAGAPPPNAPPIKMPNPAS
jgi:prepilin-type N-terminal cleavage/methylation domain-containing protein